MTFTCLDDYAGDGEKPFRCRRTRPSLLSFRFTRPTICTSLESPSAQLWTHPFILVTRYDIPWIHCTLILVFSSPYQEIRPSLEERGCPRTDASSDLSFCCSRRKEEAGQGMQSLRSPDARESAIAPSHISTRARGNLRAIIVRQYGGEAHIRILDCHGNELSRIERDFALSVMLVLVVIRLALILQQSTYFSTHPCFCGISFLASIDLPPRRSRRPHGTGRGLDEVLVKQLSCEGWRVPVKVKKFMG